MIFPTPIVESDRCLLQVAGEFVNVSVILATFRDVVRFIRCCLHVRPLHFVITDTLAWLS